MAPHPNADRLEQITGGRRLSVEEYHRLIERGVLDEDDHVQLLDGELVAMTLHGPAHARVIERLTRLFAGAARGGHRVLIQLPLALARSEPEPDLAVVAGEAPASIRAPHPATALLVIEVASGSMQRDRTQKAAIYAEAGVAEYWIVDVEGNRIEVRRDPDPAARAYRELAVAVPGARLRPQAIPILEVDVAALLQ
jgi:Uma2 family endonuclease